MLITLVHILIAWGWEEKQPKRTWVIGSDRSRVVEVTVVILRTICLIVGVHRVRCMRPHGVGFEARAPSVNRTAVHSDAAHVVYVRLQRRIAGLCSRHAPLPAPVTRGRRRRCLSCTSRGTQRLIKKTDSMDGQDLSSPFYYNTRHKVRHYCVFMVLCGAHLFRKIRKRAGTFSVREGV